MACSRRLHAPHKDLDPDLRRQVVVAEVPAPGVITSRRHREDHREVGVDVGVAAVVAGAFAALREGLGGNVEARGLRREGHGHGRGAAVVRDLEVDGGDAAASGVLAGAAGRVVEAARGAAGGLDGGGRGAGHGGSPVEVGAARVPRSASPPAVPRGGSTGTWPPMDLCVQIF